MFLNNGKHLPQIEYFYKGEIYPFIGKADLKTLIQWRLNKLNIDAYWSYNKDARNTYDKHLACIEQCCRILFSNPNPEFAINALAHQITLSAREALKARERTHFILNQLTEKDRKELLKLADKFYKS